MKQPAYKILLLTIALVLVTALVVTAQTVDRTTLNNKVACGYQGWFACPGDGSQATVGWHHWSDDRTDIGPGLYRTDVWPDIAEYSASDLYTVPNTTLVYGGTPKLFSSRKPGVTNTHFRWMQENQIDGVFVQRYTVVTIGNPNDPFQEFKDTVLQNVMDATVTYGRAFAITYDISATPEAELYDRITNDWNYLKNTFNIKNHSRYWYHNGQPVIMIWGLGFSDRPGTPAMAQNIINFFKNDGCFVLGGVPWGWRTLGPPSKTDPAWNAVYRSYDGISPWSIGLYSDWASINSYKTNYAQPDINECNSLGIYYMPTSWPRFGWDNMNEYPCGQSKIGTRGGQQLWDQFYAFKSIGAHGQYVAMFDEYDESTAIMKLTDNVPTSGCWFNTEGKGSDWQLRLTNQGSKMQRGEIALSQTIPINSAVSPDNAVVVSDTIPTTMTTGQQYNVSVTMQNTGETCWNAEFFQLGTVDDSDPFYASTRVFMPAGTTVMPNGQYTFNFTLTAPSTPGTYTTDWQMVHAYIRWFGGQVVRQVQVSGPAGVGTLNSKAGGTITVDGN
ncbi:MAG: NBR1-Ig-like domain-containing protein, partial [Armatimonadota bacterium]|nr:NBR1-Ig-like domain-containing protein [Armatimonadota bacterium]